MSSKRLIALLVALGLAGFAFGYLGTWPPVATVMSGSMSPTINTGDVVVLKRIHGTPRVGDIVAVSVPDEARSRYGYPPVVTHRVVSVGADGTIKTKGDARKAPDPFTVKRGALRAEVLTHIPAAGRVLAFLVSPMGLLWLVGGAVMLFVMPFMERRQEAEQAEHDALTAMQAELHVISEELARLRTEPVPEPVQAEPAPAEEEPMPPSTDTFPKVDWLDLETTPDPPEFLPDHEFIGRDGAPEPVAQPEPELEPITYVVRRRSGGLLARLR